MSKLLSLVLDTDFAVENPFLWKTRTDTVMDLKAAGAADLIPYTVSCSHTRGMTTGYPHCGCCSQCIDRRFAILAAGCGKHDPSDSYELDVLTDLPTETKDRTMLERYMAFAAKVEAIQEEAAFFTEFPEAYDTINAMGGDRRESAREVVKLCKRHGEQINGLLDRGLAKLAQNGSVRQGKLPGVFSLLPIGSKRASDVPAQQMPEGTKPPARAQDSERPRCAPMTRTEIARRLLNKSSARPREVEGMMQRYGLRQEDGKLHTICVDQLDPETKKRLLKTAS